MRQRKNSQKRAWIIEALGVCFLAASASALHAAATCDVRAFGAKGDGVTKDTAAIQSAIDACEKKGGGTVELPAGTYVSAPIVLKSNITLHLDKGATLLGSPDHGDYPAKTEFHVPDVQPLLSATDAENIAITGEGTIDGNGESWWQEARSIRNAGVLGNHPRPKLVIFDHCKHVRVEGVTVQNSPMWQLVPYYSDDVTIRNVRILAPQHSPNTDAIDPFSSSHVLIEHVYSDVGDDNVAIKSGPINSPGPDSPSTDITIRDCTFMHGHGVSVGSELSGGAENILAERIHFEGTDNGIRVKANRDRGHDVGHLVFRDLDMKDVKNAIIISEYYPKVLPPADTAPQPITRLTPHFHDITIENVTATGSQTAGAIVGLPESDMKNVGNAIIISEYYPKVLPPADTVPQPITRLTPHFHDITIENVTATGSQTAGAIVGLPESPVKNVVLHNVNLSAKTGLTIGYADVTGTNVVVQAAEGEAIMKEAGAQVTLH